VPSRSRRNWQDDDASLADRQIPEPFLSREEEENSEFGYAAIRKWQQQAEVDDSRQLTRKKGIPIRTDRAPEEGPPAHPMQLLTQRRQIAPAHPKLEIQFVQGLTFGIDNEKESSLKSAANINELMSTSEVDESDVHKMQEPPEEEEDEVDNDMTIRRFFDGRTIRMIHLSDEEDQVIIEHSDIDVSELEMNLSDWNGGTNGEESEGEGYFDI
jgi:hypothetical protein